MIQGSGRFPIVGMLVKPDLLCSLGIIQGCLQQGKIAFQVMIALLERYRHPLLHTRKVLLRGERRAIHLIEGGELAFPNAERKMPVIPGRIGRGIAGINP
ncbi:hypothetical protein D3C75_808370 [compost metagenome]